MANNVNKEEELYEPMKDWLYEHLSGSNRSWDIVTVDSHSRALDSVLEEYGVLCDYPQTVGLDIQIDVLGIMRQKKKSRIVFVEAKKTPLNLHDLGQLWAYCKLCDPDEAFLLSSAGLGSLGKILNGLSRTDLLNYGEGRTIKKMQVAKWDISRNSPDYVSLVPKM